MGRDQHRVYLCGVHARRRYRSRGAGDLLTAGDVNRRGGVDTRKTEDATRYPGIRADCPRVARGLARPRRLTVCVDLIRDSTGVGIFADESPACGGGNRRGVRPDGNGSDHNMVLDCTSGLVDGKVAARCGRRARGQKGYLRLGFLNPTHAAKQQRQ